MTFRFFIYSFPISSPKSAPLVLGLLFLRRISSSYVWWSLVSSYSAWGHFLFFIFWDDFLRGVSSTTGFPSSSPHFPWSRILYSGQSLQINLSILQWLGSNWRQMSELRCTGLGSPILTFSSVIRRPFHRFLKGKLPLLSAGEMMGFGWAVAGRVTSKDIPCSPLIPAMGSVCSLFL